MTQSKAATKPCAREGCDNPRHITPSGKVASYCFQHQREYMAAYDSRRGKNTGRRAESIDQRAKNAGTRVCNKCGERKPCDVRYFPPARRGLSMTCRVCKPVNVLPLNSDSIECCLIDHNDNRLMVVRLKIIDEQPLPRDPDEVRHIINGLRQENLVLEYGKAADTPPIVKLPADFAPVFWRYQWSD